MKLWFAYVVEQGCPAQPLVVGACGHGVEHLEGVVEVVLVAAAMHHAHSGKSLKFGEYELEQPGAVQQVEAYRGARRAHNLAQFVLDALHGDYLYAAGVAADSIEGLGSDAELQLRCEAHGAHHAQGVVAEGDVGVEGRADGARADVVHAAVQVDELAEGGGIHADGHGVDGEVAAGDILFKRAALHYGVARLAAVALATCTHKLQFQRAALYLRGAVGAEHVHAAAAPEATRHGVGEVDAGAYGDEVDVLAVAADDEVAHVAAHGVCGQTELVGRLPYCDEYRIFKTVG